jgi:hypothetical protein
VITSEQAAQYLDQALGITVPGFWLDAQLARVADIEPALIEAGYSAEQQIIIQSMTVAILAAAGAPRRIQSQGAPSGASRSFKHAENALSALRRSLIASDPAGVTRALVGPDPSAASLLMVV